MRKSTKLMAGLGVVAGLGVALAPLATFAEPAGSDSLTLNVTSSCTLDQTESTDIEGVFVNTVAATDTPEAVQLNGDGTTDTHGTLTFDCTVNSKVDISAARGAGLVGPSGSQDITAITGSYTGANIVFTNGTGTDIALGQNAAIIATGTAVAGENGAISFTRSGYKATPNANQAPGSYTGTVTYTWALGTNN